ncbi:MAG TPA: hypothetical protein VHE35_33935 [Kofleriaceae bacterium]|nr:hypothetical protein [Kofleriaceae bacterium]
MDAGAKGLPAGETRGYVPVPADAFVSNAGEVISPIIYVNRCRGGCSFTKSSLSDAISNQTIIGGVPAGTRMTLSEFGYSDDIWNQTIQCIREVYQPFNVQIVTEDPGATAHHEAVLAGRASEMSLGSGILGIAPLDSSTCRPQNNVISFAFANDHGPSPLDMCWTVAQESAHAYGLDHEHFCPDPMTYLPIQDCGGQKFFRNVDAPCGEFADRECICGGTTQNSFQRQLGVHGPGTVPVDPPVVDIKMPADGATGLPRTFSVFPTAVDPRGLNHLELWINGWKWSEVPGVWQKTSIYTMDLPSRVPDGVMDIKVKGCGDTGVCGEDNITVTRGTPCASAASCLEGQKCEAGKCFWDPPTLNIGDTCAYNEQCVSTECATVSGDKICSEDCVSGPNDRCPDGYECIAPGLGQHGACGPLVEDSGGCCSTGDHGRTAVLVNLGLGSLLGLVVVRRRRRR